ncbi:hypothetical protein B0H12DRAFT_1157423 [Mycena haematopus]|nr:hypothetical protein B0H12DRAFT_1157423 [Mycena haematopus]
MDLPQHPCYRNSAPKSTLKPDTTFTLKYMKMNAETIPARYPYALPAIEGLYSTLYLPVPFFEFRGAGAPPADLGTQGDVYINVTPGAHALYAKCEEDWARWSGPEWVCRRTVARRMQALSTAGILKESHYAHQQAGWSLASTLISGYLTGRHSSEGSDAESTHSDASVSAAFASDRFCKSKAPPSPLYQHPDPDPEIEHLERELAELQADQELRRLRGRKRELVASLSTPRGLRVSPEVLHTLETEYTKYHSDPSVSAANARLLVPDLELLSTKVRVGKKSLLATKIRRAEVEKQLGERLQLCHAIRQQ